MNDKATFWNNAGKAGLVLGCISVIYVLLIYLLEKLTGAVVLVKIVNIAAWTAKLIGCIVLLRYFMTRFHDAYPDSSQKLVFRFGMATAFLSALIFAAFLLAYYMYIDPDSIQEAFALLTDNPMFDSNTQYLLEQMAPKMPTYAFFSNLIYCFIYGTIISAILAPSVVRKNPFQNQD